jgi:hypothetical protein
VAFHTTIPFYSCEPELARAIWNTRSRAVALLDTQGDVEVIPS